MTIIKEQPILNRFQSAHVLARDAGLYAMQWFRTNKNLETEKKGPQNWVSIADHEVEKMIRKKLEELFLIIFSTSWTAILTQFCGPFFSV